MLCYPVLFAGLVVYANLNLVSVAHRAATHLCTGSSSARSMVSHSTAAGRGGWDTISGA
jgi:hypothetical protein